MLVVKCVIINGRAAACVYSNVKRHSLATLRILDALCVIRLVNVVLYYSHLISNFQLIQNQILSES